MPQTSDELVNEYMDYRDDTSPDVPYAMPTPPSTKKVVKPVSVTRRASGGLFGEPVKVPETSANIGQMEYPFEMREGLKVIWIETDKEFTVAMGPKGWGVREGKGSVQNVKKPETWKRFRLK